MPNDSSPLETIDRIVSEGLAALLGSYGLLTKPSSAACPTSQIYLGSVGFAGDELRGSLSVIAARPALDVIHQEGVVDPSFAAGDEELCDTAGELANMVIGRLKLALGRRDVPIQFSTPLCAAGVILRYPALSGGESRWGAFETAHGTIHVRLDVAHPEAFVIPAEQPESASMSDGALVLL